MTRLGLPLLLVFFSLLLVRSNAALADTESQQSIARAARARAHFELGRNQYNVGNYRDAMAEFEAGYAIKPLPLFLYNIAQAARLLGEGDKALEFYQLYLKAKPDAPERDEVEARIVELERDRRPKREPAPPGDTTSTTAAAPAARSPSSEKTAAARAPAEAAAPAAPDRATDAINRPAAAAPALATAPPSRLDRDATARRRTRRIWIGVGVGGALLVAGAVALTLIFTLPPSPKPPASTLGNFAY